jgi:hypothetical protein
MVPLSTVSKISMTDRTGYSAALQHVPDGGAEWRQRPRYLHRAQALEVMEDLAAKELPQGYGYEWTSIAYPGETGRRHAGPDLRYGHGLRLPGARRTIRELGGTVLCAARIACLRVRRFLGVTLLGLENNVYVQIGIVALMGLAAKNAILIVEFAKEGHEKGMSLVDAATEGAKLRFRPIMMTAFAFILGVIPLVVASGAGAAAGSASVSRCLRACLRPPLWGCFSSPCSTY